jgi:DNA-binding winged helix-turn-helix (wHTH) protein
VADGSLSFRTDVKTGGSERFRGMIRFDSFELDIRSRELCKHGLRIRLQDKSFQFLTALLESPGEIVSREELQRRLWPGDTQVDFESGLNTAARRLRAALSDSADEPRYVQTVARAGYRFIAPIAQVETSDSQPTTAAPALGRVPTQFRPLAAALLLTAVASIFLVFFVSRPRATTDVRFTQITFDRGQVSSARFAPDGRSVVYTAQWRQNPRTLFLTNTISPESRALGFPESDIASVSHQGELALLKPQGVTPISGSVLSHVPMNGGAPVVIDRNVMSADWFSDGSTVALVRAVEGVNQIEFPPGRVLYRTAGWLGSIRVSPRNDAVAFFEYPLRHDDAGRLALVDTTGTHRFLTDIWSSASGLAWHPATGEIWFTASREPDARLLLAVTRTGRVRLISKIPGTVTLRDIAPDGRLLMSRDSRRLEMAAFLPGGSQERDISWLDWSRAVDISADGSLILFDESGTAADGKYISYLYRAADHSVLRLGEGLAMAFSPDMRAALLLRADDRTRLRLLPITGGEPKELDPCGLEYQWAKFFPDAKSLLALANSPGGRLRLYRVPLHGSGNPTAISPPTVARNVAIAPDGARVAALNSDGKLVVYSTDGVGPARVIPAADPLAPILWPAADLLFVQRQRTFGELPAVVSRLSLVSGESKPWRQFAPRDRVGVNAVTRILIGQDQKSYVYSYRRIFSELLTIDGWR